MIVILADLQVPYHDPAYIRVLKKFMDTVKPDERGQIGDLMDQPEVGRWNKGAAGEFAGSFWRNVKATRRIIDDLKLDWIKVGNHDERMETYIQRYAPALGGPDSEFTLDTLLRRESYTRLERKPFRVAPGWIVAHGHEGSLSPIAGRTAFALAQRWNASVVCGHTHRAGTVSVTQGLPGARRCLTGMEIGHGMLEKHATYVKSGAPNWQRGFGILIVDGNKTYHHVVHMHPDSSFTWDGKTWRP
jgi:metallophosphoesterase superfamily enzyme